MITLNLTANGNEQTRVKEYLENNVSESLADKINNGVKIVKDNKNLINKKDLNGFMKYACDEARKLAQKGANCACIEDETVFGWAIHYFEEDSLEGTLYNEDGTRFEQPKKKVEKAPAKTQTAKTKEDKQATLFDLFDSQTETNEEENLSLKGQMAKYPQPDPLEDNEDDEWTDEEIEEVLTETETTNIVEVDNRVINTDTGEVIEPKIVNESSIDKESAIMLYTLLDGILEVRQ